MSDPAPRDENRVPATLFESSTQPGVVDTGKIDEATGSLLVSVVGITGGTSGTGIPASTPAYIGQVYVDNAGPDIYMSVATDDSGDWVLIYETP